MRLGQLLWSEPQVRRTERSWGLEQANGDRNRRGFFSHGRTSPKLGIKVGTSTSTSGGKGFKVENT